MDNNKMLFDDAEVTEGVIGDEVAKDEEKEEEKTPDEATPVQE